ncbi:MAG: type II secretion system protein [Chloroflexi bacterium]|nr:type II secretion system protein [Chloroflexota bacterium]
MRNIIKGTRSKGFTLVELMVVMAIMGVLAAIVVPAVSGTKQVSQDSQVKNDGSTVQNGVSAYYGDQTAAETLTTTTPNVLGTATSQKTSSKWPEQSISARYTAEFPTAAGTASGTPASVVLTDGSTTITTTEFANGFTAVYFDTSANGLLGTKGYVPSKPDGVDATNGSANGNYHNYLWVLKKISAGSDSTAGRTVQVFRLTKVSKAAAGDTLYYDRVF